MIKSLLILFWKLNTRRDTKCLVWSDSSGSTSGLDFKYDSYCVLADTREMNGFCKDTFCGTKQLAR